MGCKKCAEGLCGCSKNAEYVEGFYGDDDDLYTDGYDVAGEFQVTQHTHKGTREHENYVKFKMPISEFLKNNKKYITIERNAFNAEESVVQEPDWIPAGDGRAIGQQNFGINLSPLHAESAFDKLEGSIEDQYLEKGYSPEKAKQIAGGAAYKAGVRSHGGGKKGKAWMKSAAKRGMKSADTTGSPSPTFNENITGQDGPSENPTNSNFSAEDSCRKCGRDMGESTVHHDVARCPYNDPTCYTCENCSNHDMCDDPDNPPCFFCGQVSCENISKTDRDECENPDFDEGEHFWAETFEAMRDIAPSTDDVDNARRWLKSNGYGEVQYDRYLVNQQGSSNKFYYTAITEKDGKYYPMGSWGRIGYYNKCFNIAGKKESPKTHFGDIGTAFGYVQSHELKKTNKTKPKDRYVDYRLRRGAESLEEIEGPTAEATTGGLHAPSSFAMTWENGMGQSSASIPPNEIAWADTKGIPTWAKWGAGIVLALAGGKLLSARMSEQKAENNLKSPVKARKGCCGGSKIVRKDSEFSVGQINPVVVEDQNDVYGAEELHSPQTSAKVSQPNWGPQTTYLQNQRSTQKMW